MSVGVTVNRRLAERDSRARLAERQQQIDQVEEPLPMASGVGTVTVKPSLNEKTPARFHAGV